MAGVAGATLMVRENFYRTCLSVGILALGVIALLWLRGRNVAPQRAPVPHIAPQVRTVPLAEPTRGLEVVAYGTVVPARETTISTQVAGHIVAKPNAIESGNYVEAAAKLLTVDPSRYELVVRSRAAHIKQVEADTRRLDVEKLHTEGLLDILDRQLLLAAKELEALRELAGENAAAQSDVDRTERELLQTTASRTDLQNQLELLPVQRERLAAQLAVAQAELAVAELDLKHTEVAAPHAGVITHDLVEIGDYVEAGDQLLMLQDTSLFEVEVELRADQLYWIWTSAEASETVDPPAARHFEIPSAPATVSFEVANRTYRWPGRLARLEGAGLDPQTHTARGRVEVDAPIREDADAGPPALVKGMFVTVRLQVAPETPFLAIPNNALQPNDEVWSVSDGRLRIHKVRPVKILDDVSLVPADAVQLQAADRVVVSPLRAAFDGLEVREAAAP